MTKFPKGTRIAIPLIWEYGDSESEWVLVGLTPEDDAGVHLPILDDGEETGTWGSDYALRDPQTGEWSFLDGERCDDAGLLATFERRQK